MEKWGKNNDFHIILPLSYYERLAGSHCWILVDHAVVGGKYTFFMFLQSIDGTWIKPFAVKVRKSRSTCFTFDNVVGDLEFFQIFNASFLIVIWCMTYTIYLEGF